MSTKRARPSRKQLKTVLQMHKEFEKASDRYEGGEDEDFTEDDYIAASDLFAVNMRIHVPELVAEIYRLRAIARPTRCPTCGK